MYDVVEYLLIDGSSSAVRAVSHRDISDIIHVLMYAYITYLRDGVRIHERSINYNLAQPVTAASERVEYGGTGAF